MAPKTQIIEVDEATAATLRGRAEAQGMSVAELVAGMTAISGTPVVPTSPISIVSGRPSDQVRPRSRMTR
jgi:anaerobic C4-dicarboxylate transporter